MLMRQLSESSNTNCSSADDNSEFKVTIIIIRMASMKPYMDQK